MRISYNKLWKLLIDKNMTKMDLKTSMTSSQHVSKLKTLLSKIFGQDMKRRKR